MHVRLQKPLLALAFAAGLLAAWPAAAAGARPPVVVLVFDEFPTTSLLDEQGRIDAVRYPSFARLAHDATWFPHATASVDETGRAMESLLTGITPERRHPATFRANPHNLFTLLGRRYRMHASEEVTSLCPRRLCPAVGRKTRVAVLHELAHGRAERFARWVRGLGGARRPTLHFKHVLLPHVPLRYLPSGRLYSDRAHEPIPGILRAFHHRWLVTHAYQRHLLQLGFTDRLLGGALRRLRETGLYRRALIVVTADNGESFGRFGDRHVITRLKAADIGLTPLFIKTPFQRHGRIVRRHVRTVDVVPTIAHVLRLRIPWRTEGRSVFGPASRRIPRSVTLLRRSGGRLVLSLAALRRLARRGVERKLRLFGSGSDPPGLHGIGPNALLLGTPLALWPATDARGPRALIHGRRAFRHVHLRSRLVPARITGRIVRNPGRAGLELAIAVNGWIAATAPTFSVPGSRAQSFAAMVPEGAFREGANRVEVVSVSTTGRRLRLRRLGRAG